MNIDVEAIFSEKGRKGANSAHHLQPNQLPVNGRAMNEIVRWLRRSCGDIQAIVPVFIPREMRPLLIRRWMASYPTLNTFLSNVRRLLVRCWTPVVLASILSEGRFLLHWLVPVLMCGYEFRRKLGTSFAGMKLMLGWDSDRVYICICVGMHLSRATRLEYLTKEAVLEPSGNYERPSICWEDIWG